MKIALCLLNYFPHGGLQRDFFRIAQQLIHRGHEVEVFTLAWQDELPREYKVHILPKRGLTNHARAKHFSADCKNLFRNKNFDLIMGFNKLAGLDIYYAADSCLTYRMQSRPWWKRLTLRYWQYAQLENNVFKRGRSTRIFCLCEKQAFEYQTMYNTETDRIIILPPTLAPERKAPDQIQFAKEDARTALRIPPHHLVLLFIASRFHSKGLDRVIFSLAQLPEMQKSRIQLFVIGNDHAKKYQRLAKKQGVDKNIVFCGGQSDIQKYLLAANGLVHPARVENTGTVLLEAMILGVPVITVERCGYASFIKDHCAGMVLEKNFNQADWNQLFNQFIQALPNEEWEKNGLAFGKNAHLYRMPEIACEYIEQIGSLHAYVQ